MSRNEDYYKIDITINLKHYFIISELHNKFYIDTFNHFNDVSEIYDFIQKLNKTTALLNMNHPNLIIRLTSKIFLKNQYNVKISIIL